MVSIDLHGFLIAFWTEWNAAIKREKERVRTAYNTDATWTEYMLGDDGLLTRIGKRLSEGDPQFGVWREYYTVDAMFAGGETLFPGHPGYPSCVYAVIEHENGPNLEEEMWKLIHWRAPLKVLIGYDWIEPEKIRSETKRKFMREKLDSLLKMLDRVDRFHGESSTTEYLFLFGGRKTSMTIPEWSWASNLQRDLRPIGEDGAADLAKRVAAESPKAPDPVQQKLTISLSSVYPLTEAISEHGAIERDIAQIVEKVSQLSRASGHPLRLDEVSYSVVDK